MHSHYAWVKGSRAQIHCGQVVKIDFGWSRILILTPVADICTAPTLYVSNPPPPPLIHQGGQLPVVPFATGVKVRSSDQGTWSSGQAVKLRIWGWFGAVKVSLSVQWAWLLLVGQGQIFGAVKGSSTKIWWVKILTPVANGTTGAYVTAPPPCTC